LKYFYPVFFDLIKFLICLNDFLLIFYIFLFNLTLYAILVANGAQLTTLETIFILVLQFSTASKPSVPLNVTKTLLVALSYYTNTIAPLWVKLSANSLLTVFSGL